MCWKPWDLLTHWLKRVRGQKFIVRATGLNSREEAEQCTESTEAFLSMTPQEDPSHPTTPTTHPKQGAHLGKLGPPKAASKSCRGDLPG